MLRKDMDPGHRYNTTGQADTLYLKNVGHGCVQLDISTILLIVMYLYNISMRPKLVPNYTIDERQ